MTDSPIITLAEERSLGYTLWRKKNWSNSSIFTFFGEDEGIKDKSDKRKKKKQYTSEIESWRNGRDLQAEYTLLEAKAN